VRTIAIAIGVGVLALVVGVVLTLLDNSYSHGGRMPFSFKYKGLYRTAPNPGGYVKIARTSSGRLDDSYAVAPLILGSYSGNVSGELPLYATSYVRVLTGRFADFRLEGEGKTRISSTLGGYNVLYSARIEGHKMYGRDVMLLPERRDAREGVVIEMLSSEKASVAKPVASSGVLETPLKTFAFG
jgi:hypothetical protein